MSRLKFRTHFDIRDWGVGIRISRYHPPTGASSSTSGRCSLT